MAFDFSRFASTPYLGTNGFAGGILGGAGQSGGILGGGGGGFFRPEVMLPIAGQMIAGRSLPESLAGAFTAAGPAIANQKKRKAIGDWMKAGMPKDPNDPSTQALFSAAPELAEKYIGAQFGTGSDFGNTPLYFKDKDGNLKLGRFNGTGGVSMVDTPGLQVADPITYLNTGTQQIPTTKRGGAEGAAAAGVEPLAIDNAGKARDEKAGGAQGDAIAAWRSMESKMPSVETVVTQLDDLANKATYTAAGVAVDEIRRQLGAEPRESAVARAQYIAIVDNQILPLLRDTFGAQFTVKEGETLRATLGDPNKAPAEKQAVLKAFIEQKRRDVKALAEQAGQAPAGGNDEGGWTDLGSGVRIRVKPQ